MELGGAEWSWVEVDGAGWRWVHGLVVPIKKNINELDVYSTTSFL